MTVVVVVVVIVIVVVVVAVVVVVVVDGCGCFCCWRRSHAAFVALRKPYYKVPGTYKILANTTPKLEDCNYILKAPVPFLCIHSILDMILGDD